MKSEKFKSIIEKWLADNAIKTDNHYPWILNTDYGPLHISIDQPEKRAKILAVYSRFDDPKQASDFVNCNPYSGKWNFHYFSSAGTAKQLASEVINQLIDVS